MKMCLKMTVTLLSLALFAVPALAKGKIDGKTMSGTTDFGMGTGEWKAEKAE